MASAATPPASVTSENRERPAPEVIDVDAFQEDDIVITGYGRAQRSRPSQDHAVAGPSGSNRDVIVVSSDDEEQASTFTRRTSGLHRLVSPPPPSHTASPIPPVPTVPRHLRHAPPVIRPNAQPFPFEAQLRQASRNPTPQSAATPQPAPRSHHQPVMGLGGALIALNRQNAIEEASRNRLRQMHAQRQAQQRSRLFGLAYFADATGYLAELYRNITGNHQAGFDAARLPEDEAEHDFDPWDWLEEDGDFAHEFVNGQFEFLADMFRGRRRSAKRTTGDISSVWRPSFTHPDKPGAGFTFHFAPADSPGGPGPSSSRTVIIVDDDSGAGSSGVPHHVSDTSVTSEPIETKTLLVCAHCLDPLLVSSDHRRSETDEDRKKRRVWALRCGHLFDGKCVEALMRPPVPGVEVETVDPKGKGKARAEEPAVMDIGDMKGPDETTNATFPDKKGKGKAVAASDIDSQQGVSMSRADPEDNSIRSRLRSRHRLSTPLVPSTAASSSAHPSPGPPAEPRPMKPLPRRRRGTQVPGPSAMRSKGKGRARKYVEEQVHEWTCPVPGCGRVHRSLRMGGEGPWKMDEKAGAVALFV